ncbi:oxaloacetate decarboxylase subunit gamma [Vibrio ruber]|uniref:Probable oxaloacetate decarboxylase gamma chain n=1 Tax=Vibrio ruber (strain DSM 16370 / JCM 11486 / BCRC 17186 / CECT 7878 / LMG 23124 / VR1) TaxID=1123498 RepID=A0A1R4LGR6_VIBR1|nr:oxaloacetate decarboxylase subunit gamma [Vibrio ruber]WNJ94372.1 oxaloacetate decarboxylase subunit gamma [Vibrio ruber]SJN55752.1 oxaloacetate decarboxylase subunit gamma [Vibrio ruber DSM 16370]
MSHIGSLLSEAATLMMTGMLVVFAFLTIMVYLVTLMSKIVPQETPPLPPDASQSPQTLTHSTDVSPQVVAAISAAVHQYRSSAKHK